MSDTTVEVKFGKHDVYVIVTPDGEEVHVTRGLALTIQYALLTGADVDTVPDRWDLLGWLNEHAVQPYLRAKELARVEDDTVVNYLRLKPKANPQTYYMIGRGGNTC